MRLQSEGFEVTVHPPLRLGHLNFEFVDLLVEVRSFRGEFSIRLLPGPQHELIVLQHRLGVLYDGGFQQFGPHVSQVAAVSVHTPRANVVVNVGAIFLPTSAEHDGTASTAPGDSRQKPLVAVVQLTALRVFGPLLQYAFCSSEELLGDDRLMASLVFDLPPPQLADVERVAKDVEHPHGDPTACRFVSGSRHR